MDYIYSQLNEKLAKKLSIDYLPTNISGSSTVDVIKLSDNDYKLDVNTQNLVRLLVILGDINTSDDVILRFRLLAYNKYTNDFDIPLGDDILINHNNSVGGDINNITHALIAGLLIPASVDSLGQLVLQYIPIQAISDKIVTTDSLGNTVFEQVESTIDCND